MHSELRLIWDTTPLSFANHCLGNWNCLPKTTCSPAPYCVPRRMVVSMAEPSIDPKTAHMVIFPFLAGKGQRLYLIKTY